MWKIILTRPISKCKVSIAVMKKTGETKDERTGKNLSAEQIH